MADEINRIVYLFCTGASHAEIQLSGKGRSLLMNDVKDQIIKAISLDAEYILGKQNKYARQDSNLRPAV